MKSKNVTNWARLGVGASRSLMIAIAAMLALLGPLAANSRGAAVTEIFNYTGSEQTWVVPAGVTSIQVDARGAQGGCYYGTGGKGAQVQTTLFVTPGETLYIYVGGCGGSAGWKGSGQPGGEGGYNGGGSGATAAGSSWLSGGGGGGASDIRRTVDDLSHRIVVAGGGGGGTSQYGGAGGYNGEAGEAMWQDVWPDILGGGGGGTQTGGGYGGAGGPGPYVLGGPGAAGVLGVGGNGGSGYGGGAGGGGGYYGGGGGGGEGWGGGDGASGGGGSSYSAGTGTTYMDGYQSGNGQIILVPEPATLLLLGLGAVMMRRRKH